MTIRTLTPRNLMVAALLLCIAGCGCNDDTFGSGGGLFSVPAVLGVQTTVPPIPVDPPPAGPIKIDITFVMDDGDAMDLELGNVPQNPDFRLRNQASQAIFHHLQAQIQNSYEREWLSQNPGKALADVPAIDLAFAVARYEDFGGPFSTRFDGDVDDVANPGNDQDARPFILNMPILRLAHPDFATNFADAMQRKAPGDGSPINLITPSRSISDPQSALEALWQIAAPTEASGDIGGFDANKDGDTKDSGAPTYLGTPADPRNPQTLPGASGDVPAIRFVNPTIVGGHPHFTVADEDGTPVMTTLNPTGTPASGNLGQVGWRPDAARFVILASSIATVCPTTNVPGGGPPPVPSVLPPPSSTQIVMSTPGAPTAPRSAEEALLLAFDGGPQIGAAGGAIELTAHRRTGMADDNLIAPTGAHTVEETIKALNDLDIEVLFLGCTTWAIEGNPVKPGVDTGVNGDKDSHIVGDDWDPTPTASIPTATGIAVPHIRPWFWMNAVNTLTTPPITSRPETNRVTPEYFWTGAGVEEPTDENLFWAVYNMGTVWPFDAADPDGDVKTNILMVMPDDLAERIVAWIDGGFITGGSGVRPPLPTVEYVFTLDLGPALGLNPTVIQGAPLLAGQSPKTSFTQTVNVPRYWSDEARPADLLVEFPLPADGLFQFIEANATVALPAQETFPFEMMATFSQLGATAPANLNEQAQILAFIKLRGDGHTLQAGAIKPLDFVTQTIIQAQAAFTAIVRDSKFPGPGAQLGLVTRGCAIITDETLGQNSTPQVGGTCPFPPPPVVP